MDGGGFENTGILAETLAMTNGGDGGRIEVITERLEIRNAAVIKANSINNGKGGKITVTANVIVLDGEGIDSTGIVVLTFGDGDGDNIDLKTGHLEIRNAAQINASTSGTGDGGTITIAGADTILIDLQDNHGLMSP